MVEQFTVVDFLREPAADWTVDAVAEDTFEYMDAEFNEEDDAAADVSVSLFKFVFKYWWIE